MAVGFGDQKAQRVMGNFVLVIKEMGQKCKDEADRT